MPPITDPNMLAQIKAQQGGLGPKPQTLAGPVAASAPIIPNGTVIQPTNLVTSANTQADMARTQQLLPGQLREQNARIANEELAVRQKRIAMGLDPDTGKPAGNATGPFGPDAMKGLGAAEQDQVKAILQGRWIPSPYQQTRDPEVKHLLQVAYQVEPGLDIQRLAQRGAAYKTFLAGSDGKTLDRINQALQHLDRFHNSAIALNNYHNASGLNPASLMNYPRAVQMAIMHDPKYQAFATDRDAVATELAAAFKGGNDPALASVEHWQKTLGAANSPESFDSITKEATGLLGGRIDAMTDRFRRAVGSPMADSMDLINPQAKAVYQKFSDPNFSSDAPKPDIAMSSTSQAIKLPPEFQQAHEQFLTAHPKGSLTVPEYMQFRQGLDKQFGTTSALTPAAVKDFVDAYNQQGLNPKQPVPVGSVPLTGFQAERAKLSESPVGTFLENAANAGTMGAVDLAAGDAGRDAQSVNNEQNSKSAFLGDMAGSILPIMGLTSAGKGLVEKLLPHLADTARATLLGNAAGNMTYGAARGFNGSDTGEGAEGAFNGAGAGALGSALGDVATRGIPALFNPVTEKAMGMLKNVDLTTLQRLGLGRVENGLRNLPFVRGGTAKAMDSMNTDRANNLLSLLPEDEAGQAFKMRDGLSPQVRNDGVYQAADISYDNLKPQIVGSRTADFENTIEALGKDAKKTAYGKDNFGDIQEAVNRAFDENGHFDGEGYKSAMMRLRSLKQDYLNNAESQGSTHARDLASTAEAAAGTLKGLVKSQVPENVANGLDNTDRVWAGMQPIFDATNRATASNGGVYSPGQALTSLKKMDLSNNDQLFARGKMPGQDYLQSAQHVMGSGAVPESVGGWGAAEGGAGLGTALAVGAGAPVGALLGATYAPGVKRVIQAITTGNRPTVINNSATTAAVADALRKMMTGN